MCVRKKVEKGCEAGAMRFIRDLYPHARMRQERPWCCSRTFQENVIVDLAGSAIVGDNKRSNIVRRRSQRSCLS